MAGAPGDGDALGPAGVLLSGRGPRRTPSASARERGTLLIPVEGEPSAPILPPVISNLEARFTFVVGKGGVGKSTAAAALALGLTDDSEPVHLISTDPAHSLGDLFEVRAGRGEVVPSPCTPLLSLEELDAPGRARAWMERVGDPVLELLDLGTYLEKDDIRIFLDLVLPGVDEFMGALRLVELEEEGVRVVVDTAPTGHTLRLLDSDALLASWVKALDAIADKVGAVQERLVRRRVRLRGEEVVEELRGRVTRFEERVLGEAVFLVVSRPGSVVVHETARLRDHLLARGLRVAAELRVAEGGDSVDHGRSASGTVPLIEIPWGEGLRGCEGLRRWGRVGTSRAPGSGRAGGLRGERPDGASDAGRPRSPMEALRSRKLLFVAGKGGVGKSTCAAACALALSREGPVLLLSTDPAGSLEDVLGLDAPIGGGASLEEGRLRVRQVHAAEEFQAFRERYRDRIRETFERLGLDRSARLDRRVLESLLGLAPPGIDEIFALRAILEERDASSTLVLDTAPTGHFLRMVEMPEVTLGWTRAVLRILLKYRSVLELDDFGEDLLQFARRLDSLVRLLRDPERTGVLVVTLGSAVVRSETERLLEALRAGEIPVLGVIRNRLEPISLPDTDGRWMPWTGAEFRAPEVTPSPVGPAALSEFFSRWELVS